MPLGGFVRFTGTVARFHGGGLRIVSSKVSGVNVNTMYNTAADSNNTMVVACDAFSTRLLSIHPLAAIGEFVRYKDRCFWLD